MVISKELSESINNLQSMAGEIQKTCNAIDFIYDKAKEERGVELDDENWVITLSTLALAIILRVSSFLEEIDKHFLKHYSNSSIEINESIQKLRDAYAKYDYETLRNAVLAHPNRIREKGMPERILTFPEIQELVPSQNHTEYMKFGELTNNIRQAMLKHFINE